MLKKVLAVSLLGFASLGAQAANVIGDGATLLFGTGVQDGNFTVTNGGGVAVGLRARTRNPVPTNDFSPVTGTTYQQAAGGYGAGGLLAGWNFDWSINAADLGSYTYALTIGYAGGSKSFDLIRDVQLATNGYFDHAFGSASAAGGHVATSADDYAASLATNTLVQNSWNLAWFTDATHAFDPTAAGEYTITLSASNANGLATATSITVQVDAANDVPEPSALALLGLGLAGLAVVRRRKTS